jgi:hypothetical protein
MQLRQIAHARSGDKGDISQISVIAFDEVAYKLISSQITTETIRELFGAVIHGKVERFELPHLGILNFVLYRALSTGVTRSLALDPHGKCFSSLLLELPVKPYSVEDLGRKNSSDSG